MSEKNSKGFIAAREKFWSEVDADEKCRRLRKQVKRLETEITSLSKLIAGLLDHEHLNGRILQPLYGMGNGNTGFATNYNDKDDVYF